MTLLSMFLMILIVLHLNIDKIGNNGTKNNQIMVPLKYLSTLLRTLEMPLSNCEINIFFNLI